MKTFMGFLISTRPSDFMSLKELTAKSPSDQHLRQAAAVFTAFPINPESQLKASAEPNA